MNEDEGIRLFPKLGIMHGLSYGAKAIGKAIGKAFSPFALTMLKMMLDMMLVFSISIAFAVRAGFPNIIVASIGLICVFPGVAIYYWNCHIFSQIFGFFDSKKQDIVLRPTWHLKEKVMTAWNAYVVGLAVFKIAFDVCAWTVIVNMLFDDLHAVLISIPFTIVILNWEMFIMFQIFDERRRKRRIERLKALHEEAEASN